MKPSSPLTDGVVVLRKLREDDRAVVLSTFADRLEVRTHPDNAASQRLAARCGFQREGLERRSIWLHGERHDAIVWSLLPGDPR